MVRQTHHPPLSNRSRPMLNLQSATSVYCECDMVSVERHLLPAGEAVVYTSRSPDKKTPNEDAAALLPFGETDHLLTVADGMGGSRLGEVAARLTIEALRESLSTAVENQRDLRSGILNGIEAANARIIKEAPGAGTTVAALEITGHTVRPYHVGDSVILVVGQRGKLKLLTVPHSPVALAVVAGVLNDGEAMHHKDRHLIHNSVGDPDMRIEMGPLIPLARYDTALLASDGLLDNLTVPEIVHLIRKGPLRSAIQATVQQARKRMVAPSPGQASKPDDLTIVAYRRR